MFASKKCSNSVFAVIIVNCSRLLALVYSITSTWVYFTCIFLLRLLFYNLSFTCVYPDDDSSKKSQAKDAVTWHFRNCGGSFSSLKLPNHVIELFKESLSAKNSQRKKKSELLFFFLTKTKELKYKKIFRACCPFFIPTGKDSKWENIRIFGLASFPFLVGKNNKSTNFYKKLSLWKKWCQSHKHAIKIVDLLPKNIRAWHIYTLPRLARMRSFLENFLYPAYPEKWHGRMRPKTWIIFLKWERRN